MKAQLEQNAARLYNNAYPGRGIVIGLSPDETHFIQVYWIMGRSENSRNRVFNNEGGILRAKVADSGGCSGDSLTIYSAMRNFDIAHIVANGDHTDTIFDSLAAGKTFQDALSTRTFEPDGPNYTPRISGIIDLRSYECAYELSIVKTHSNDPNFRIRNYFSYEAGIPGVGHCITTYAGAGNPLPAFGGEPYLVELFDEIVETKEYLWNILNVENRVSVAVKFINRRTNQFRLNIRNKYEVQ